VSPPREPNHSLPSVAEVVRDDAIRALSLDPVEREVFLAERAAVLEGLVANPLAALRAAIEELQRRAPHPGAAAPGSGPEPPAELPFVTGDKLALMTPAEPDYVVKPFFARGTIVQLAGKVKGGKTTLALHAVAAVLLERPFLADP